MLQQLIAQAEGNQEIIEFINTKIRKVLEQNDRAQYSQTDVEHIIDYLKHRAKKAEEKRHQLRLRKMSIEQAHQKAQEWTKTLIKKGKNIIETEEDVEVVKVWKDGMRMVKLVGENAFKREGKLMSHCVGSYYGKAGVEIFSLRDQKNEPHCTIEKITKDGYIQQIKGKGNGSIHPRYIKYVIKMLNKIGKEVRGSELSHLGYVALSRDMWTIFDKCYSEVGELTFQGSRYYYTYSKPQPKVEYETIVKLVKKLASK